MVYFRKVTIKDNQQGNEVLRTVFFPKKEIERVLQICTAHYL